MNAFNTQHVAAIYAENGLEYYKLSVSMLDGESYHVVDYYTKKWHLLFF